MRVSLYFKPQHLYAILILLLTLLTSHHCDGQRYLRKKQKWKHLGPTEVPTPMGTKNQISAHGMGLVQSLFVSTQTPGYLIAGSNSGGVYKSLDDGKTWKSLNNFGLVTGVLDIEVDSVNENEIWIATGTVVNKEKFGHGVLHSIDGGQTWEKTGLDFAPQQQKVVWQIARSKSHPDVFYACTDKEVYRSKNRGKTWRMIFEGRKGLDFRELVIHPSLPDYVVVSGEELVVTKDGGDTWSNKTTLLQYSLKRSFRDPNRIAVGLLPDQDSGFVILYKAGSRNYIEQSLDWGESFQLVSTNRYFNRVDKANAEIAVAPGNESIMYVGCVRTYKSVDKALKFKQITFPNLDHKARVHDDIREMVLIDSNTVYVGCDGGVSRTTDGGVTWEDLSGEGLAISQFYGVATVQGERYPIMGGCQDLSSIIFTGKKTWSTGHLYGDGGNCIISPNGDWIVMKNGMPNISRDTGKTWSGIRLGFNPNSYDYPIQLDPSDPSYLFTADHYLFRHKIGAQAINISKDVPKNSNKIRALDVNDSYPDSIVFAKDEPTWGQGNMLKNKLYRSKWIGDSLVWEDITFNQGMLAWRSVEGISSHSEDPNTIWICLYGSPDEKGSFMVFKTTDRGETWTDASEGLPGYNTYEIVHIDGSQEALFLATDGGIYFRNHRSNKWVRMKGKMPEIMVKSIAINYKRRRLIVGTYGNGIWEMKIPRRMFK